MCARDDFFSLCLTFKCTWAVSHAEQTVTFLVEFHTPVSVVINNSDVFLCSACILVKMWLGRLSWQLEALLQSCLHLS